MTKEKYPKEIELIKQQNNLWYIDMASISC